MLLSRLLQQAGQQQAGQGRAVHPSHIVHALQDNATLLLRLDGTSKGACSWKGSPLKVKD